MSHNETRDKILKTLYVRYFDESMGRPLDTDEILEHTFQTNEITGYYPEINYLQEKGFIHGELICGCPYPKGIRIKEYGIDRVERNEPELRDLHYQKRLKILEYLYAKYFKGNDRHIAIDKIILDTEIGDLNSSEVIQEFNYLYEKRLIESNLQFGRKRIRDAKISSYGIDEIELILNQSIQEATTLQLSPIERTRLDELKNSQNSGDKFSKAIALSQEVREWADLIVRVAQTFLGTAT